MGEYVGSAVGAMLRSKGLWSSPQPWLFTFLAGSNAERVAAELMQGLTGEDLGAFGRVTFYPMRTNACRSSPARLPDDSVVFPFNVARIAAGEEKVEQMIVQNSALYQRIRRAGGSAGPSSLRGPGSRRSSITPTAGAGPSRVTDSLGDRRWHSLWTARHGARDDRA